MRRCGTGCVMASKKGAANARREPVFDSGGPDLHASADERSAPDDEDRPRPRSRKRRVRKKRPARNRRALIGRIAYWGLVVGLWLAIGGVGMNPSGSSGRAPTRA